MAARMDRLAIVTWGLSPPKAVDRVTQAPASRCYVADSDTDT